MREALNAKKDVNHVDWNLLANLMSNGTLSQVLANLVVTPKAKTSDKKQLIPKLISKFFFLDIHGISCDGIEDNQVFAAAFMSDVTSSRVVLSSANAMG